jgi:hypothetical protein
MSVHDFPLSDDLYALLPIAIKWITEFEHAVVLSTEKSGTGISWSLTVMCGERFKTKKLESNDESFGKRFPRGADCYRQIRDSTRGCRLFMHIFFLLSRNLFLYRKMRFFLRRMFQTGL